MPMIPISRGGPAIDVSAADHTEDFDSLYIGVTGDVHITKFDGTDGPYLNVPVGWMPVAGSKVFNSGTDATGIILEKFNS